MHPVANALKGKLAPQKLTLLDGLSIFKVLRIGRRLSLRTYRKGEMFYTEKPGKTPFERYRELTVIPVYWDGKWVEKTQGKLMLPEYLFVEFAEESLRLKQANKFEGEYWIIEKDVFVETVYFADLLQLELFWRKGQIAWK